MSKEVARGTTYINRRPQPYPAMPSLYDVIDQALRCSMAMPWLMHTLVSSSRADRAVCSQQSHKLQDIVC